MRCLANRVWFSSKLDTHPLTAYISQTLERRGFLQSGAGCATDESAHSNHMIKDLLVIVDGLTKKAGPYALSLASMFDAHICALSAGINSPVEPLGYSEVRHDRRSASTLHSRGDSKIQNDLGRLGR